MQRKAQVAANKHGYGTNIKNSCSQGCQGVKRKRAQAHSGNHDDKTQTGDVAAAGMPPATKRDQGCKQKSEVAKLIGGLGPKAWASPFTIVANWRRPGQHDTTLCKRCAPLWARIYVGDGSLNRQAPAGLKKHRGPWQASGPGNVPWIDPESHRSRPRRSEAEDGARLG